MITLSHGAGGFESGELIKEIRKIMNLTGDWKNTEDDAAVFDLDDNKKLVFTTDGFIVDPVFFPGGNIGTISMTGTINDLVVMGAKPLGLSLSFVIEEGFPKKDFMKIVESIHEVSKKSGVPVVTGDTKVTDKGKIDKIEITTSGIGIAEKLIPNDGIKPGDDIISSGDLGEHGLTLLAHRFDYKTDIKSDCHAFNKEIEAVGKLLHSCKDPTRGGAAANLNEMAEKSKVKIVLDEKTLPYKKEVSALTDILGLDIFSLPSEGRFVAACSPENTDKVLKTLKSFNNESRVIGRAEKGEGVWLNTRINSLKRIEIPHGKLIPRIC